MARKFIQMGWTRARRYANHGSGTKYNDLGDVLTQSANALVNEKAKSAEIFKQVYDIVRKDEEYLRMKDEHKKLHKVYKNL